MMKVRATRDLILYSTNAEHNRTIPAGTIGTLVGSRAVITPDLSLAVRLYVVWMNDPAHLENSSVGPDEIEPVFTEQEKAEILVTHIEEYAWAIAAQHERNSDPKAVKDLQAMVAILDIVRQTPREDKTVAEDNDDNV